MNALLVCSSYGGGGAEKVAANLSCYFSSANFSVSIYYWDEKGDQSYQLPSDIELIKSDGRSIHARISGLRKLLTSRHFDVIISFADIANILAYFATIGLPNKPRRISTIHTNLLVRDSFEKKSFYQSLIRFLHKQALQTSHITIAVSDGARDALIDYYGLPACKVARIYNPVFSDANTPETYNRKLHKPVKLVAAGRFTLAKNYRLMLEAIHILKNEYAIPFSLSIFGSGELKNEIITQVKSLGLSDVVELKGFVPNLAEQLEDFDIFIMSSNREGLGNVLIEALAAGLRIVSTDCPSGPSEILSGGRFGKLTPVNDARMFAQTIAETINQPYTIDPVELDKHLQQFSITRVGQEYIGHFNRDV